MHREPTTCRCRSSSGRGAWTLEGSKLSRWRASFRLSLRISSIQAHLPSPSSLLRLLWTPHAWKRSCWNASSLGRGPWTKQKGARGHIRKRSTRRKTGRSTFAIESEAMWDYYDVESILEEEEVRREMRDIERWIAWMREAHRRKDWRPSDQAVVRAMRNTTERRAAGGIARIRERPCGMKLTLHRSTESPSDVHCGSQRIGTSARSKHGPERSSNRIPSRGAVLDGK